MIPNALATKRNLPMTDPLDERMEELLVGYAHGAGLGVKPLYIVVYLVQLPIHVVEHAQYSIQLLFYIHPYFTTHIDLT
jgi:hypothetical protein